MVRVESSQYSKEAAHNLDDSDLRHEIRSEGRLWAAEYAGLNEFEKLVRDGEITLFRLPASIIDAQVGQIISLERGHDAYQASFNTQNKLLVDTQNPRRPSENVYDVIYQGPASQITYRHPKTNTTQVASSQLINFVLLEKLSGKYLYTVAFYDPRS